MRAASQQPFYKQISHQFIVLRESEEVYLILYFRSTFPKSNAYTKPRIMKTSLLLISYIFFGSFFLTDSQSLRVECDPLDEKHFAYIYAPNGLNMREGPNLSDKKLTKIPYGAKVEVLAKGSGNKLSVDGLTGSMAHIKYQDFTGYAFEGYLSQFSCPPKQGEEKVRRYVETLRIEGHMVFYEKIERDYDGYFQFEESIIIHQSDWEEAFLVAKELFHIPPKLNFPPQISKSESVYVNPDKKDFAWSDELKVTRERGLVTNLNYYFRGEGGGTSVNIAYFEPDSEGIKISRLEIAD